MQNSRPPDGGNLAIKLEQKLVPPTSPRKETKHVVLLVHGASASSRTFEQEPPGLIGYLQGTMGTKDLAPSKVYTLDWRSSMLTSDELVLGNARQKDPQLFTLDAAVADLVNALEQIVTETKAQPEEIRIVGHCIGGALVAQAIAQGFCKSRYVVLSALALFFKVGVEGWFKGNDFVLEDEFANALTKQASSNEPPLKGRVISAMVAREPTKYAWPAALEERYRFWLDSGLHHGCGNAFCERISFMYGMPFRVNDMAYLHDGEGKDGLEGQFGSMPLGIYAHCLRNLRRGWAAPYNGTEGEERAFVNEEARKNFAGRNITLITGNENQVWHRNSLDLMHEWLGNGRALPELQLTKHVLRGYGHQDLYWSTNAPRDVYPLVAQGLGVLPPPPKSS
jgi:pimeloyl-ACP methyl ester carboxylesterase